MCDKKSSYSLTLLIFIFFIFCKLMDFKTLNFRTETVIFLLCTCYCLKLSLEAVAPSLV